MLDSEYNWIFQDIQGLISGGNFNSLEICYNLKKRICFFYIRKQLKMAFVLIYKYVAS